MILLLAQRGIQYLYSELPDTVEVNYIEAMTSTSYFISGRLYGNYYYQPDPRGGNYSIGFATFQGVFNPAVSLKKVIALSAMLYGEYWRGDFIYNTTVYEANKTYLFGERGPYAYVSRFTIGLPLLKSLLGVVQLGQTWLNWSPFFAYRVWGIPGVQIKGPFYKKWGYQVVYIPGDFLLWRSPVFSGERYRGTLGTNFNFRFGRKLRVGFDFYYLSVKDKDYVDENVTGLNSTTFGASLSLKKGMGMLLLEGFSRSTSFGGKTFSGPLVSVKYKLRGSPLGTILASVLYVSPNYAHIDTTNGRMAPVGFSYNFLEDVGLELTSNILGFTLKLDKYVSEVEFVLGSNFVKSVQSPSASNPVWEGKYDRMNDVYGEMWFDLGMGFPVGVWFWYNRRWSSGDGSLSAWLDSGIDTTLKSEAAGVKINSGVRMHIENGMKQGMIYVSTDMSLLAGLRLRGIVKAASPNIIGWDEVFWTEGPYWVKEVSEWQGWLNADSYIRFALEYVF